MSIAIGVAALALQLRVGVSGQITAGDFLWPFVTLGAESLLSARLFWRLGHNVGHEVSGHRPPAPDMG